MKECKNCKKVTVIVNKRHFLCSYCNNERLHGSKYGKVYKRKKDSLNIPSVDKKFKRLSVFRTSDGERITQQEIERRYEKTQRLIVDTRERRCESCGRSDKPLSFSHIISRKRAKEIGASELIYDPENILLECYEPPTKNPECCHNQHEEGNFESHLSFEKKMKIFKRYDINF